MSGTEQKALQVIWNWGGEASIDNIAREAGISINYARLLCQSLDKEGSISFLHSKLARIKSKGKLAVAGKISQTAKKIVIPQKQSKFGLDKNKKGRLNLGY